MIKLFSNCKNKYCQVIVKEDLLDCHLSKDQQQIFAKIMYM